MVKGYYRMISGVDRVLGRLLEELAQLGLDRNTVIVFTSDNGYFLGERGFAGKWLMHEPSIRVPLIVRDPRLPRSLRGSVRNNPVLNIDVAPTLLDMAGVPIPAQMQGRSFLSSLKEDAASGGRDVFCEHLWNNPQIPQSECLRTDGWKYIRYLKHPEYEELYNLSSDPLESRNLARDPEQAARLKRMWRRCQERAESLGSNE
jgi:arylsulfatase A-like enzyme